MWRRYRRTPLANPYFPKRTRKRSWRKIFIVNAIAVALAIVGVLYSPLLRVKTIELRGLTIVSADSVREHIRGRLAAWARLPFIREAPLESSLKEAFSFYTVSVRKEFPDTLIVDIEERLPHAIWQTGERAYVLDQTGTITIPTTLSSSGTESLLVYLDESGGSVEEGTILSPDTLATIDRVREAVRDRHGRIISLIKFPSRESPWVKFVVDEGWEIHLDLTGDVGNQLTKLGAVLEDLGDRRSAIHYIDVRFADRVYYQ